MHVLLVSWLLGLLPESFDPFFVLFAFFLSLMCIRKGYSVFWMILNAWKSRDSSLKNGLLCMRPKGHVIYLCDVTLFAN